ncbi:MAG: hypothetical protein AAE983_00790 [Thermoplasmataceae archaeon]
MPGLLRHCDLGTNEVYLYPKPQETVEELKSKMKVFFGWIRRSYASTK